MRRLLPKVACVLASVICLSLPLVRSHVAADGEINVSIEDVDDSGFPVIKTIVRADQSGKPLNALSVAQVQASEAGTLGTVTAVDRAVDAGVPLGLVLVIDVSGSMAGAPLASAKASAATLVRSLAPGDGAALISFSSTVAVEQPMTTDRTTLLAAIDRLAVAGNTALYDAVATAAELAAASPYQRRAVVLLSDGREAGGQSTRTREQALGAASAGGVLFYAVGFGADIDRPYLDELAQRSGGAVFLAPTVSQMAEIFDSIQGLLRSHFLITFTSRAAPSPPSPAGESTIAVTLQTSAGSGKAERTYKTRRPVAAPTPVTPAAVPVPATIPPPAKTAFPTVPLLIALLMLTGSAGSLVFVQRSRSQARARALAVLSMPDVRPLPSPEVNTQTASSGRLTVSVGPNSGVAVEVGDSPVTIGSSARCALRLSEAPGVGAEHARVWRRDGRPMLHHLDPLTVTRVNGRQVDWTSLVDADEIAIGPYVVRYESANAATPIESTGATGHSA